MASRSQTQWRVVQHDGKSNKLQMEEVIIPEPGEYEVLVKIHAVSLNFRDLMILRGDYPFSLALPVVPCSDGAGEVVKIGSKASLWAVGDKVITVMNQSHLYGPATKATAESGLGGGQQGTLRQYGTFNEQGLVRAPRNLSFAEASTLPCAGVTAWNALYGMKTLRSGQSVLILGTGGVSVFALQFAKAAGAVAIVTTSSDEKSAFLERHGANHIVNYKRNPEWGQIVKDLSPSSAGVDQVVEVGGVGTLQQSLKAVRPEGVINCVGSVSGSIEKRDGVPSMIDCWLNNCVARGVSVGSRAQMEEMVAAVQASDIRPVVDGKKFSLREARDAFDYYSRGRNFGKVVVNI